MVMFLISSVPQRQPVVEPDRQMLEPTAASLEPCTATSPPE